MAAPTPPTGYSSGELDGLFADLFNRAEAEKQNFLKTYTTPELQPFLNYYLGVPPAGADPTKLYANIIATGVIKGTPGKMISLLVVTPGSGGNLRLNNCATVGAATSGNRVIDYNALAPGQVIDIGFVCDTGIVVSSIMTGGQYTLVYT